MPLTVAVDRARSRPRSARGRRPRARAYVRTARITTPNHGQKAATPAAVRRRSPTSDDLVVAAGHRPVPARGAALDPTPWAPPRRVDCGQWPPRPRHSRLVHTGATRRPSRRRRARRGRRPCAHRDDRTTTRHCARRLHQAPELAAGLAPCTAPGPRDAEHAGGEIHRLRIERPFTWASKIPAWSLWIPRSQAQGPLIPSSRVVSRHPLSDAQPGFQRPVP